MELAVLDNTVAIDAAGCSSSTAGSSCPATTSTSASHHAALERTTVVITVDSRHVPALAEEVAAGAVA